MNTYVIRWRGRLEGPLTFEEIERRLNAGSIGLLTELQVEGGHWMTLRDFYAAQAAGAAAGTFEASGTDTNQGLMSEPSAERPPFEAPSLPSGLRGKKRLAAFTAAALLLCVISGLALVAIRLKKPQTRNTVPTPAASATLPAVTNHVVSAVVTNTNIVHISLSNSAASKSSAPVTNAAQASHPPPVPKPSLPPLPENEPRTFRLKNGTNYTGTIVSVDKKGLIIKMGLSQYTPRLAWALFNEEDLAREASTTHSRSPEIHQRDNCCGYPAQKQNDRNHQNRHAIGWS